MIGISAAEAAENPQKRQDPKPTPERDFCKLCRDQFKAENKPEPREYPCGNVWCGLDHKPQGDPIYPDTSNRTLWERIQDTIGQIIQNIPH